jgi:hypothetical protein
MKQRSGDGQGTGKLSKDDYMKALEAADLDENYSQEEEPELSEAERLAAHAEPPKRRIDGKPVGSERERPLTAKQYAFARGLIEGKTQEQAYRDAYPDAQAKPQVIKTTAWRLSQDRRIQRMLNEHWGETVEALSDDSAATKRFVLKSLLHYVREGKQETTRLKALELMGKTVGMFTKVEEKKEEVALTAEQLKRDLAGHVRLLGNVRPMNRIIDVTPVREAVPMQREDV